jgi:hypothetical protein
VKNPLKKRRTNRTLAVIKDELEIVLKRETVDIIAIGGLLIEAKAQVKHGLWLKWLTENFSLSTSSAERYIKLHKGAAKIPNFGNLKIRPSLLDKLILYPSKRSFPPEVQAVIFKEAETKWVGLTRAYQIEHEIKRAEDAAYKAEIKAIESDEKPEQRLQDVVPPWESEPEPPLDVAPIPAEVTPALLPRDQSLISTFQQTVKVLKVLAAKPAAKFVNSVAPNDLQTVADFLKAVAGESVKTSCSDTFRQPNVVR